MPVRPCNKSEPTMETVLRSSYDCRLASREAVSHKRTICAKAMLVNPASPDSRHVRVPKGDTIEVRGGFDARWVRLAPHEWRLLRLATRR